LRRAAAADRDRAGAGRPAAAAGRRRADLGAGRLRPVAGGAAHAGPGRGVGRRSAVHQPRPVGGAADRGPDRGDVPGPDRRGGRHGRGVGGPASPVHEGAAGRDPEAGRPGGAAGGAARRRARPVRPAAGLPVPSALPGGHGRVPGQGPGVRPGRLLAARTVVSSAGPVARRLAAAREAMAAAGIDALVLRPSPDFRLLGGRGRDFLVVTRDRAAETADPCPWLEGARRVGVDGEMRVRELFGLAVEAELVPAGQVLAPLRLRKEPEEVAAVGRAALAAEAVLGHARELSWFGATERAMAARLRVLLLETGCEKVLSVRVAAGEPTAAPGDRPTGRVRHPGAALLV